MIKSVVLSIFAGCMLLTFSSCNMATPENYFDYTVLNCNMMMGFASNGLQRELDQPSAKLVEGTKDQTAPMKRKEVIADKITYLEDAFKKLKDLKETEDTKDILQTSIAVYNYVLPVYKNEYVQLAKLYDENAPANHIASFSKGISDKYLTGFKERFDKLVIAGKPYAERHHINVNWDVNSSPTP